jgi:HK97 family phage major capsid protein
VTLGKLLAAEDLRALRHGELVGSLSLVGLLSAPASQQHDPPAWRALSNLISADWQADAGLPSPTSWWGPRRSDAKLLAGRGLTAGSSSAAGNLAITSAVAGVAAAIRPRLVLEQAGAIRQEVSGQVDAVALEWSGGSGAWVNESVDVPTPALSLTGGASLPKTAGCFIEISRRLLLQAEAVEQVVAAELARLVAGTVEGGLINGSGVGAEPLGLLLTPGATAVSFAAATPTYAELVEMVEAYFDNDGDPDAAAWLMSPVDFTDLLTVTQAAGTGQYAAQLVGGSRYVLGIRAYLSNHVPAGQVILCDPRNLLITYWRAPLLIVNPYALDTSGGVRLTVLNDVNITVRHRPQLVIGG